MEIFGKGVWFFSALISLFLALVLDFLKLDRTLVLALIILGVLLFAAHFAKKTKAF